MRDWWEKKGACELKAVKKQFYTSASQAWESGIYVCGESQNLHWWKNLIGKEGGFLGNFKETNQPNFNHGTFVHVHSRSLEYWKRKRGGCQVTTPFWRRIFDFQFDFQSCSCVLFTAFTVKYTQACCGGESSTPHPKFISTYSFDMLLLYLFVYYFHHKKSLWDIRLRFDGQYGR